MLFLSSVCSSDPLNGIFIPADPAFSPPKWYFSGFLPPNRRKGHDLAKGEKLYIHYRYLNIIFCGISAYKRMLSDALPNRDSQTQIGLCHYLQKARISVVNVWLDISGSVTVFNIKNQYDLCLIFKLCITTKKGNYSFWNIL